MGRWPGGCTSEAARARLQAASADAIGSVPAARWTLEQVVEVPSLSETQAACVRFGGFILGAQRFDSRAFGVSSAEAGAMDPQQRLLLELGYASLHGAASVGRR